MLAQNCAQNRSTIMTLLRLLNLGFAFGNGPNRWSCNTLLIGFGGGRGMSRGTVACSRTGLHTTCTWFWGIWTLLLNTLRNGITPGPEEWWDDDPPLHSARRHWTMSLFGPAQYQRFAFAYVHPHVLGFVLNCSWTKQRTDIKPQICCFGVFITNFAST